MKNGDVPVAAWTSDELNKIFDGLLKKVQVPGAGSPFAEITDEDIDSLFSE